VPKWGRLILVGSRVRIVTQRRQRGDVDQANPSSPITKHFAVYLLLRQLDLQASRCHSGECTTAPRSCAMVMTQLLYPPSGPCATAAP
jgi:hypothetical protein